MIRKLFKGALACLLLTLVLAVPASAETIGGATVSGTNVRLRTSPDTSSSANIIKQMNKGTFLLVEEKCGGWYKVVCDGVEGYVSADYATFSDTLDGTYTFSAGTDGTSVNLRSAASTGGAVVKNYPANGTALTVTGVSGTWLNIPRRQIISVRMSAATMCIMPAMRRSAPRRPRRSATSSQTRRRPISVTAIAGAA